MLSGGIEREAQHGSDSTDTGEQGRIFYESCFRARLLGARHQLGGRERLRIFAGIIADVVHRCAEQKPVHLTEVERSKGPM